MANKGNSYFNDFITMAGFSCEAAKLFQDSLKNFNPETLMANREKMHVIENNEDRLRHEIFERLVKEFIPPIDREDIIQLANELDNVTDKIEDILIHIDIFNVQEIHPAAMDFADVIVRCCETLNKAMMEFPNFRKSASLRQAIIDLNNIEEECDDIYIDTMRNLYKTSNKVMDIFIWSTLFEMMEACCDTCEYVSDIMDIIIMKNS